MPSRSFLQYLTITAKGLAMGAADVVPGVSGGTIAFIALVHNAGPEANLNSRSNSGAR